MNKIFVKPATLVISMIMGVTLIGTSHAMYGNTGMDKDKWDRYVAKRHLPNQYGHSKSTIKDVQDSCSLDPGAFYDTPYAFYSGSPCAQCVKDWNPNHRSKKQYAEHGQKKDSHKDHKKDHNKKGGK